MSIVSFTTKVLFLIFISLTAYANPIFEGYYKLNLDNVHIGYIIQRYSLNSQKKVFSATHYVYLKVNGVTSIESLHAESDLNLKPLSYKFTSIDGKNTKTIDAVVQGNKLAIKIVENGKARATEHPLNDKVFFSTFLSHMILKNKKGMEVGNKYEYKALAEEDGRTHDGVAWIKEQVKEQDLNCFRILNTFKNQKFVNYVNLKGESIKTFVPTQKLESVLVKNPKDAYKDLPFDTKTIQLLFNNIPGGTKNMLSKKDAP